MITHYIHYWITHYKTKKAFAAYNNDVFYSRYAIGLLNIEISIITCMNNPYITEYTNFLAMKLLPDAILAGLAAMMTPQPILALWDLGADQ